MTTIRKINRVGHNTLTVSLPSDYIRANNLDKGDELFSNIDGDRIVFSVDNRLQKKVKEVTLNIDGLNYYSLSENLTMLYRTNYNRICLLYSKKDIEYQRGNFKKEIRTAVSELLEKKFVGMEIISHTKSQIIIECFLNNDEEDLNKIEKRIYFLFKEAVNELLSGIGKEDFNFFYNSVKKRHDNITRFINYFLRRVDRTSKNEEEKKVAYGFYVFLDIIVDKLKYVSDKIKKKGCSEIMTLYLGEIFEFFFSQFDYLYKKQFPIDFIRKRYEILEKLENEKGFLWGDVGILVEVKGLLDTMNKFSEYMIVKNI